MDNNTKTRFAIAALGTAKISGIIGLLLGYTSHRTIGGILLAAAGALLCGVVATCYKVMKAQGQEEWHDAR